MDWATRPTNTVDVFTYDPFTGISTELPHLRNIVVSTILTDGRLLGYSLDTTAKVTARTDCQTSG